MATTTNYGWTTPDDTALVKDGAAAIRTLGSSVDTTTKNLNPSTTLGDIEYRSSTANTNTRLGIGTTGQVLTVAGGVPSWASSASGSLTLLSTTTMSGTSTTISSISGSYKNLYVEMSGLTHNTSQCSGTLQFNSSALNYVLYQSPQATTTISTVLTMNNGVSNWDHTSADNFFTMTIYNYASSTTFKNVEITQIYNATGGGGMKSYVAIGGISSTTAISSLVFGNNDGKTAQTGTIKVYGVN
jgi:hypothetical protein